MSSASDGGPAGRPTPPNEVRDALGDVAELGGFFALATGPAEGVDPSWRPLTTLLAPDDPADPADPADPDGPDGPAGPAGPAGPLARRVSEIADQLGASRRIAASLLQMSLATRSVSLLLAAAVEHRVLPLLDHAALHWRPWSGGPLPLWVEAPRGESLGPPEAPATADRVVAELVDVHLRPLVAAVDAVEPVPGRTAWGNAAAALGGAVRVLALSRPASRDAAAALAAAVVARGPFRGLGEFVAAPDHPTGLGFARRSCCLYYRVPGGGLCADCVLVTR